MGYNTVEQLERLRRQAALENEVKPRPKFSPPKDCARESDYCGHMGPCWECSLYRGERPK